MASASSGVKGGKIVGILAACLVVGYLFLALSARPVLVSLAQIRYPDDSWLAWLVKPDTFQWVMRGVVSVGTAIPQIIPNTPVVSPLFMAALYASALIVVASIIHQGRGAGGAVFPVVLSLVLGFFSIPIICWIVVGAGWLANVLAWVEMHLFQFFDWLKGVIAAFFAWSATFWAIVGIIAGIVILVLIARALWRRFQARAILRIIGVFAAVAVIIGVPAYFGWWPAVGSAVVWALSGLVWLLGWVIFGVLWVIGVVALIAVAFGVFAYPGFFIVYSFWGAIKSGAERHHAINLAAGVGVAWSLIFTAGTVMPQLGAQISTADHAATPHLLDMFHVIIPGSFQLGLASLLSGSSTASAYGPNADLVLILLVVLVGFFCLAFRGDDKDDWAEGGIGAVFFAVLGGLVVAILILVPLLIIVLSWPARVIGGILNSAN